MTDLIGELLNSSNKDIFAIQLLIIGISSMLGAYLLWLLIGKDPKSKNPYPQYKIPEGLSPGIACYINTGRYSNQILSTTIISLAQKGIVDIIKGNKVAGGITEYTIKKSENLKFSSEVDLLDDEYEFLETFFPPEVDSFQISNESQWQIRDQMRVIRSYYNRTYKEKYFKSNAGYYVAYLALTIVAVFLTAFALGTLDILLIAGLPSIFISLLLAICFYSINIYMKDSQKTHRENSGSLPTIFAVVILFCFSLVTFLYSMLLLDTFDSYLYIPGLVMVLTSNLLLLDIIKVRTKEGNEAKEFIEGLKLFLDVTEEEKANLVEKEMPSDLTKLSKYFPYAHALNFEKGWARELFLSLYRVIVGQGNFS